MQAQPALEKKKRKREIAMYETILLTALAVSSALLHWRLSRRFKSAPPPPRESEEELRLQKQFEALLNYTGRRGGDD